jgi:hypothetical protein
MRWRAVPSERARMGEDRRMDPENTARAVSIEAVSVEAVFAEAFSVEAVSMEESVPVHAASVQAASVQAASVRAASTTAMSGEAVELPQARADMPVPEPEPTGHPGVDAALDRLRELAERPTGAHPELYDDVHRRLQDALAEIEQQGPRR